MPYSEDLAERVREVLAGRDGVNERSMFGGVGFMVNGNMAVGVIGDELVVRLSIAEAERALSEPGVREFDFTGRKMKGWLFVSGPAIAAEDEVEDWVDAGAGYAASLPPKS